MNRKLSVYVDLLRLGAALLVLVGHAGEVTGMWLPTTLAHSAKEGVGIFFVLSGFVISFVTSAKERDWGSYARARAVRMYSVVPLAIVTILVCDAIGTHAAPGWYAARHLAMGDAYEPNWSIGAILRYLSFTNELWFSHIVIGSGSPYWSLGFEIPYYVLFAILCFARGGVRALLVLAWALVCGPKILLALPLWLIGVATWRAVARGPRLVPLAGALTFLGSVVLVLGWRLAAGGFGRPIFEWGDAATIAMSLVYYYVLSTLIGLNIVAFAALAGNLPEWPARIERAVRWLAGGSFSLYILHAPIMTLAAATLPGAAGDTRRGLVILLLVTAGCYALAELGERRKRGYERAFTRLGWRPHAGPERIGA